MKTTASRKPAAKRKGDPAAHRKEGQRATRSPVTMSVADALQACEGQRQPQQHWVLRLYIAGFTSRSTAAISSLKALCEEYLNGRYELDVVDIFQQPNLAKEAQITAVPALIRKLPLPLRQIVGDMANKDRVLMGLDLMACSSHGAR